MSDARLAFVVFFAALLARMTSWMGSALFSADGASFLLMADWMREGRFHDALLVAYHPLYPLLTSVARSFVETTEQAGDWVSIGLGALATVPLFWTVRRIFGRSAAFITALLYALHPRIVEVQADTMTEGTFMFFFLSALWLTWRLMEEPSPERGAALGLAAAAAFLTRPEGMLSLALAIAWPVLDLVRRREGRLRQAGSIVISLAVMLILLAPYLFWVRSVRGTWAISVRSSAVSLEQALGMHSMNAAANFKLYKSYASSILRLTHYGALLPLYALGLAKLRKVGWRGGLFYFSFGLGLMGGVWYTLRAHNAMSERYLMLAMSLMSVLAALGTLSVFAWAARRWPESSWRPWACAGFLFLIAAAPGLRCLRLRRQECLSYPVAARWILLQNPRPQVMSGLEPEVGYLTGSRPLIVALSSEHLLKQIKEQKAEYFVYTDKDVDTRYVGWLHACPLLEAPVEIVGPPGTDRVYVQWVRRE